jgi:hypothetical protein
VGRVVEGKDDDSTIGFVGSVGRLDKTPSQSDHRPLTIPVLSEDGGNDEDGDAEMRFE